MPTSQVAMKNLRVLATRTRWIRLLERAVRYRTWIPAHADYRGTVPVLAERSHNTAPVYSPNKICVIHVHMTSYSMIRW